MNPTLNFAFRFEVVYRVQVSMSQFDGPGHNSGVFRFPGVHVVIPARYRSDWKTAPPPRIRRWYNRYIP